jgi:hypothetical protein
MPFVSYSFLWQSKKLVVDGTRLTLRLQNLLLATTFLALNFKYNSCLSNVFPKLASMGLPEKLYQEPEAPYLRLFFCHLFHYTKLAAVVVYD